VFCFLIFQNHVEFRSGSAIFCTNCAYYSNDNANNIKGIVHYGSSTNNPTTSGYDIVDECVDETNLVPVVSKSVGSSTFSLSEAAFVGSNEANYLTWTLNSTSYLVGWDDPVGFTLPLHSPWIALLVLMTFDFVLTLCSTRLSSMYSTMRRLNSPTRPTRSTYPLRANGCTFSSRRPFFQSLILFICTAMIFSSSVRALGLMTQLMQTST
jgi:hypothetical protein